MISNAASAKKRRPAKRRKRHRPRRKRKRPWPKIRSPTPAKATADQRSEIEGALRRGCCRHHAAILIARPIAPPALVPLVLVMILAAGAVPVDTTARKPADLAPSFAIRPSLGVVPSLVPPCRSVRCIPAIGASVALQGRLGTIHKVTSGARRRQQGPTRIQGRLAAANRIFAMPRRNIPSTAFKLLIGSDLRKSAPRRCRPLCDGGDSVCRFHTPAFSGWP